MRATDNTGAIDDQLITVTVSNLNEAPTEVLLSSAAVSENTASGMLVGKLTASDPDAGDSTSFALLDDAAGRFAIANGNQLVVANGVALDFEQSAQHQVKVRVTDSAGTFFDQMLSIGVTNVDPDNVIGTTGDDIIHGGALADELQGNFGNDVLIGGDGNDSLAGQYDTDVLTGGAGIDTFSGSTTDWNHDRITDYEYGERIMVAFGSSSGQFYRLRQTGSDTLVEMDVDQDGTFNGAVDTSIILSGVIEGTLSVTQFSDPIYVQLVIAPSTGPSTAPVITSNGGGDTAALTIAENGATVTTVKAIDPDVGATLIYSIVGGADAALFTIDANTGALAFAAAPDFETPTDSDGDNVYNLTVRVSDGEGGLDTQAIAVSVTNVAGISPPASNAATITGTNEEDVLTGLANANTLLGLAGNDLLNGGGGNDTLDGGVGADRMAGGAGNDSYFVDNAGDVVIENAGAGTDTVRTALAVYSLATSNNVENLTFVGQGPFSGTGNGLVNVITGGSANDVIDGGEGNDRMVGGLGDDTYHVGSASDVVTEAANAGNDLVLATSSAFTLGANIERLTFIGAGNFAGTGNGADNAVTGGTGDDTLDGRGGDDVISGGSGADHLIGAGGADRLDGGLGVDRLEGGGGDDVLIGGSGNDELIGDGGADLLDGGLDADRMEGGAGADTYIVDSAFDVVVENAGDGADEVRTDLQTYSLSANIETLTFSGLGSFTGAGNGLNNILTGGASGDTLAGGGGNDRLSGLGGDDTLSGEAGADILDGGSGNDVLTGGAGNDTFVFSAGFGHDTIIAFGDVSGDNDIIQFSSAVFANFNDVIAASQQVGTDIIITINANNSVTLVNVAISTIGANDLFFI